jgi:integrase
MKAPRKPAGARRAKVPAAQQQLDLRDPGQPTLGEVMDWYTREYMSASEGTDEQRALSTRRGWKSTVRKALAHFSPRDTPTKGDARAWLRPMLLSEGGMLRARAVNAHRDRLHAAYVKYRDEVRGVTLNPFAFPRFREDTKHLRTSFEAVAAAWPRLLAAMPDDRARLFLTLALKRGFRLGELLGLEWGHVLRTTKGGWVVRKEQQRQLWKDTPKGLKHDGLVGTFRLTADMVQLLHATRRALEEGAPMLGCARGSLVGDRPGADGHTRSFVFPYREKHLDELSQRLHATCPEEFPKGQSWHRLRRAFARFTAETKGMEQANRLLGHAYFTSTQVYCREVVGVVATERDVEELDAEMEKTLSASEQKSDNVFQGVEQ